ncbi:MAG: carbohydrate ABC transporter permease [Kiloniellaceae bacterium]
MAQTTSQQARAEAVLTQPRIQTAAPSWVRENLFALVCIAPSILVLFALTIFPLVYAAYISFHDFYMPRPHAMQFVGLQNYGDIFVDSRFWISLKQSAFFMVGSISVEFILGASLALFFFEEFRGRSAKAAYLPMILVPMMIAPVVVGYMWRLLYQVQFGPINYLLLEFLNIGPFEWTSNPQTALLSVIIADIWQWTPFVTLVMLAGIVSLPQELFEVAEIDGASVFQRARYIILPMLRRVIAIILLIRVLDAFREFDKIFVLTQGGPGTATETAVFYAYLSGFKYFKVGYASAMSILLLIVTVIICVAIAKVFHKEQPGEA